MALATLCNQVRSFRLPPVTAFIVDHRLRPESTQEAQSVGNTLLGLGIHCKVLTADWKGIADPSQISNLESAARRMRFQALGRACADADIDTLLLAHHADDQAETVLSRIHAGYLGSGLIGVQPKMPIGECHGMYKVSKSGTFRRLDKAGKFTSPRVESGGVVIHRPLLDFTKSELIATCESSNVRWHEDATNADKTLTPRNAIRQMLQSTAMPSALSSERLRKLAANRLTNLTSCEETATTYFNHCRVELDHRTGSVSFQIHLDIERWLSDEKDCQLAAAILVRRFLSLVEDQSRLALKDLARPVGFLFPSIAEGQHVSPSGINIGNVTLVKNPTTQNNQNGDQKKFLILPRPVRAPEEFTQTLLEVTKDNRSTYKKPVWTDTKLFHDRWWIKLRYVPANLPANTSVVVRFLRQGESTKEGGPWSEEAGLSLLPSGKLRYTIPMIVQITEIQDQNGLVSKQEKILAFPSIGLTHTCCTPYQGYRDYDSPWLYTCIYKDIDFEERRNHTVKSCYRRRLSRPSLRTNDMGIPTYIRTT
jgi:tRNA(Ile)-lysidine synthase